MSGLQVREPEVAAAIGRCVAARSLDAEHPVTHRHPRECGWCPYELPVLVESLREFNNWAQYDDRASTTGRHATRSWSDLPRDAQEARIVEAQALVERKAVPPPSSTPPVVQEAPPAKEVSPWLR